ncbi:uncharacterized protein LOC130614119 [Hydractinia symbiolongicarpus]|uniref:uncharacterized protein LOC130614119 n=1 Tax=Hydractinia symbiolongicarpus TaxID=13093 RepID=UPI00254FC3D7|nr:uncharacterized protein LOC130614119 [Hydractinia symbiolongicarpus]
MMGDTQILFYIIIIVVVVVKILFWTIYLCIRKRRLQRQRQESSRVIDTCYEEVPAVPQPAYVFSGLSPEDLRHTILCESLPGYQPDDPYKMDLPPPSYGENFHSTCENEQQPGTSRQTFEDLVGSFDTNDSTCLLGDDDEDFICLQQMT